MKHLALLLCLLTLAGCSMTSKLNEVTTNFGTNETSIQASLTTGNNLTTSTTTSNTGDRNQIVTNQNGNIVFHDMSGGRAIVTYMKDEQAYDVHAYIDTIGREAVRAGTRGFGAVFDKEQGPQRAANYFKPKYIVGKKQELVVNDQISIIMEAKSDEDEDQMGIYDYYSLYLAIEHSSNWSSETQRITTTINLSHTDYFKYDISDSMVVIGQYNSEHYGYESLSVIYVYDIKNQVIKDLQLFEAIVEKTESNRGNTICENTQGRLIDSYFNTKTKTLQFKVNTRPSNEFCSTGDMNQTIYERDPTATDTAFKKVSETTIENYNTEGDSGF